MIKIGIDPSINCTGICVWDTEVDSHTYYMIPSKMTKKMMNLTHNDIHIIPYIKSDYKNLEYSAKEFIKFDNIYKVCCIIDDIIQKYQPDIVYMEGVSYGSVGSAALVDLSFLNASIRMVLKRHNKEFVIISPTSLKKFVCGNGQAEKDIIIDAWKRMDNNVSQISDIKTDDLADAFFLAHYE